MPSKHVTRWAVLPAHLSCTPFLCDMHALPIVRSECQTHCNGAMQASVHKLMHTVRL